LGQETRDSCASHAFSRVKSSSSQVGMTWRSLLSFVKRHQPSYITEMVPESFPSGFANGQLALTRIHTGGSAYVVAREGVRLPNVSNVRQQIRPNVLFNGDTEQFLSFPALPSFPNRLYRSSQLIEVVHWAARYDDRSLRAAAMRAKMFTLSNGRRAYYLQQDTGRQGWCTFSDESAEYSDFICVNIANSPQTASRVLESIVSSRQ
jgi:hypothetical protein